MRIVYLIFLGFACLLGCHRQPAVPKEKAVEVLAYTVEEQTVPVDFDLIGIVRSSHSVEIRSRVDGYLQSVDFKEGAFVKEGDVLFKIDPRQFEDAVREAEANLEKEKAILWQAQQAVGRYKPLFEQKAASRKDLDDATAQLLSEQAAVNLFNARLDEAKLNLSYATITSPISGYTSSVKYQEGTFISTGGSGALTTVSVTDPVWVVVNVSDYYFLLSTREVQHNQLIVPDHYAFDVTLFLSDGSEYPYHGTVSFISPIFDESTGTLSARAVFSNPDNVLKPGQFVKVKASGAMRPHAIIIPQESVMQSMAGQYVFVINGKNRAEIRYVQTGEWYKQYWVILSGLKPGDRVITAGTIKVKDGTPVKIKKSK